MHCFDFRTLKATETARKEVEAIIKATGMPSTAQEVKAAKKQVGEVVAAIGDTVSVALNTYVDPDVFAGGEI